MGIKTASYITKRSEQFFGGFNGKLVIYVLLSGGGYDKSGVSYSGDENKNKECVE